MVNLRRSTIIVAGHPCTIRRGVELVGRVPWARIVEHQWAPYNRWPDYDKNHFPIRSGAGIGEGRCATLWDWIATRAMSLCAHVGA